MLGERVKNIVFYALAILLPLLYGLHIEADSISGLFGVYWTDEGVYLLSAKNAALFGSAHFFADDAWKPELIAPLLHLYGLAAITLKEPVLFMRLGVAASVILGAGLIAFVAARHQRSARAGLLCFITLLLNPVLFFYARTGLSEGPQFLIFSVQVALLYALCQTTRHALPLALANGALTAALFLAKTSSIGACAGMAAGMCMAAHANGTQKKNLLLAYAAAAAVALMLLFWLVAGDAPESWWHANSLQALRQAPLSAGAVAARFFSRFYDIGFYLSLMPVFALCTLAPLMAGREGGGFLRALAGMTLVILFTESCFGGEIRRNFFGLASLSILLGFTLPHYLRHGLHSAGFQKPYDILEMAAALFFALGYGGMVCVFFTAIGNADTIYIALSAFSLLIPCAALCAQGRASRAALVALLGACSLAPMVYSACFTPRTLQNAIAHIESLVPKDGVIAGEAAPWAFAGLPRRIIFVNCGYANGAANVPDSVDYALVGGAAAPGCMPAGFDDRDAIATFSIWNPVNYGALFKTSAGWAFTRSYVLYRKNP